MTSDFDSISPEVNHASPGKLLCDARDRMGLTREDVAKELHMTLSKIRSIELDEYNRLHSDTYIRGYLRAYGQLVKIDLQELLAIYDNQARRLGIKEEFVPPKMESSNRKIWQFGAVLVSVLLLIWLLSVWFLDNRKEAVFSSPAIATTSEAASENPVVRSVVPLAQTYVSSVGVSSLSSTEASVASTANQEISVNLNQVAASIKTVEAETDKLEFYFREECWLEVSDVKGDVLATDLQLKNTRLVLEGHSPFDIKMGNASAVSLKLNDVDVALVPQGAKVLNIKLGRNSGQ